jgi:hypothetical protein
MMVVFLCSIHDAYTKLGQSDASDSPNVVEPMLSIETGSATDSLILLR